MFIRLDTIPALDRRTDRRTERQNYEQRRDIHASACWRRDARRKWSKSRVKLGANRDDVSHATSASLHATSDYHFRWKKKRKIQPCRRIWCVRTVQLDSICNWWMQVIDFCAKCFWQRTFSGKKSVDCFLQLQIESVESISTMFCHVFYLHQWPGCLACHSCLMWK